MSIAGLQQVCSASVPPSVMCQVCSQVSLHHGAVCRVRRSPYGGHIKHGSLQPWTSSGYRPELRWVIFLASHVWFPGRVDDLNISMHTFPAHQKSMTWTRYNPWWWFHLLWVLPFQYDIVIVRSRRITIYSITDISHENPNNKDASKPMFRQFSMVIPYIPSNELYELTWRPCHSWGLEA